ncbi:MAG: DUF2889 domain-containing protein, partial [Actinomycetota bacterium]
PGRREAARGPPRQMTGEVRPRFEGTSAAADALAGRWEELAALAGGEDPHFDRCFRTRIFKRDGESLSLTELDDDFHEMRIALRVAPDGTILEAAGRMNRHPYDTCPRAVEALQTLHGVNVYAPKTRGHDRIPRAEGCLHLADMLAIAFRSFRIAKGHDLPYEGEAGRNELLVLLPGLRDTCVSFAVDSP